MNLERVKQILKKVNALIENLDDQGETSSIERDLLLRYLRDVYEDVSAPKVVNEEITIEPNFIPPPTVEPEIQVDASEGLIAAKEKSQTTFYDASSSVTEVETPVAESQIHNQPAEASINKFENPVQYFPPTEVAPESLVEPVEAPMTPEVPLTTTVKKEGTVASGHENISGRFDSLFVEKSAQDLADKYKLQSVVTIEGAMGINERMLTINELFGGEHNVFMETVTKVNNMTDLESALKYLTEGVADRFNWDAEERIGMASEFVQLVRRKFA